MIGAGSFFTDAISEGLCDDAALFEGSEFVLVDTNPQLLELSLIRNRKYIEKRGVNIFLRAETDRKKALEGAKYVVMSCEKERVPYWIQDLEIPAKFGVEQFQGENGGPGGQAHAMRNISLFMEICADMRKLCPDAWLMNFTNPMSFVCTYFQRYGWKKALGFCHQVHGSLGVVSEMLGLEPGELEFITGGINHFNWLLDIRKRGSNESCMGWFLNEVKKNQYFQKVHHNIPANKFTLDILKNFGLYCVGYDDHISEYTPFFYPHTEWRDMGYSLSLDERKKYLKTLQERESKSTNEQAQEQSMAREEFFKYPFPKDGHHPWYKEHPTQVMSALESNKALYLDSIVIPNNGAIDNLPNDALVDVPAMVIGGEVRSIHAGKLPTFAMELCRRQITIHELLVEAVVTADKQKLVQAMALDPYVRGIRQACDIVDAFLEAYRVELPQFHK